MKPAAKTFVSHAVPRTGAALLLVVLAISIASMLVLTLAHTALAHRRQVPRDLARGQAFWLVESGWQRGLLRIQREPQYTGEDWTLEVGEHTVVVQIRVHPHAQAPTLSVRTVFPPQGPFRYTWQRQARLPSSTSVPKPTTPIPSALTPENLVP